MIKLIHLIDSLAVGGTERQLALFVGALDRKRFQSHVVFLHAPNDLEPAFGEMGVPVYRLGVSGKCGLLSGVWKLRRLVKSLDIDLIQTQLFDSDVIGGIAGRLTGTPVVSTLASSVYEPEWLVDNPHLNPRKIAISRFVRALISRYCDRSIIAVSESVKQSAIRRLGLPEDKITVIYRALSGEWLSEETKHAADGARGPESNGAWPVIFNTGRLSPPKGQRYLIEAMPQIIQRLPKAMLMIGGEGPLRPQLTNLIARLGVQDRVALLGSRDDVRQLLQTSDIFVFPSNYEGCPNGLLEAMSVGLPCVASDIPAVREVTEDGRLAVLVPSRDVDALASAVVGLASEPERAKRLAADAREATRKNFAIANIGPQLMSSLESSLASG